ncbi:uncharacterized protein LOC124418766 [Lucilia cuprina]|uniref:uncharacterized protein LOC124418766 n=1 Tax=Lucilia cuprina TaxID=7375 RepID=UPI001F065916|nr:uncharacterized protein LOC124418766 [Lucilia cuprina]
MFIKNAEELSECNNKINEANRGSYVSILLLYRDNAYKFNPNNQFQRRCMSSLIKGQLHKSLTEIFFRKFNSCIKYRWCSRQALMDSIRANGEEYPEKGIRYAFKV